MLKVAKYETVVDVTVRREEVEQEELPSRSRFLESMTPLSLRYNSDQEF